MEGDGLPTTVMSGSEGATLAPLMASLSLIMIAFFILFYSMTVIDERKKKVAVGSLQGSFGQLDGGRESRTEALPKADLLSTPLVKERAADLQRKLLDYMRRRGLKSSEIKVFAADRGVDILLPHRLLFASGARVLSASGEGLMLKVAGLLNGLRQVRYELFDYTIERPAAAELSGLSLAALRASALYRFMVFRGGFKADTIRAFGRITNPSAKKSGAEAGHLLLKVIGGVPVYDLDGKKGQIKVGDFTFD